MFDMIYLTWLPVGDIIHHFHYIFCISVDVTYQHCREFVDDILLVTDEEIIDATLHLFDRGLKVEPSGAAAFAAVKFHKVPDLVGKNVVVVATGGNITIEELSELSSKNKASWFVK